MDGGKTKPGGGIMLGGGTLVSRVGGRPRKFECRSGLINGFRVGGGTENGVVMGGICGNKLIAFEGTSPRIDLVELMACVDAMFPVFVVSIGFNSWYFCGEYRRRLSRSV